MLRKTLSYILILLILSSGFTRFYFYVGYELNKNYIATVLCENINKPELKCNGKCYLSKKIKQAEKEDQKPEQTASKTMLSQNYIFTNFHFKSYLRQIATIYPAGINIYLSKISKSVFHPPQAV